MVSTDFFTVPTFTMKALFVFMVLEHGRRKVLHFNVTEHPTAAWTAQQIVERSPIESLSVISSGIGIAFTALRFDCELSRWEWKKS
jgi:hypothetical protein